MDQDDSSETFKVAITGAFIIALKILSICNPCALARNFDCDMGERVNPRTPGAVGMVWPCNCCRFYGKGKDCHPLGRTPNDFFYDMAQNQWMGKLYPAKLREGEPRPDNEVPSGWQGEDPGRTPPPLANELLEDACAVLQAPAEPYRPMAKMKKKKRQAGMQGNAGAQQQQQQNHGFGGPTSFAPPPPSTPQQHWQQPPPPPPPAQQAAAATFVPGYGWMQPWHPSAGVLPTFVYGYGHMVPATASMLPPAGRGAGTFPASPSMGYNPVYGGAASQSQGVPHFGGMYNSQAGRGRGDGSGYGQGQAQSPQMAPRQSDLQRPREVPSISNPHDYSAQTRPELKVSAAPATTTPQVSNSLKRRIDEEVDKMEVVSHKKARTG